MAELNLCVVANGVLGLLGSEEVRRSLWDSYQSLEETISSLAPFLLDAEKKSLESDEVRRWVLELGEAFYDAENYLEATNMSYYEEALKRPSSGSSGIGKSKTSSVVKKIVKKVRAIIFSTSFPLKASPSFSYYSGSGYGMEYLMYGAGYKLKDQRDNFNLVELSEK